MNEVFASEEAPVAWMRTRLNAPKGVAERQVKTEADKIREELKAPNARPARSSPRANRIPREEVIRGSHERLRRRPPRPRDSIESLAALQVRAALVW